MGMAKAFGLFTTIYQEYNKNQVISKYLFLFLLISWSVTLTINGHTLHTFTPIFQQTPIHKTLFHFQQLLFNLRSFNITHSLFSPNSHSNQYVYLQYSISTFSNYYSIYIHSTQHTLSLFSPNSHSNQYVYLQYSISTFNNYYSIYIIRQNILSLFLSLLSPSSHSNRYAYLQDSISTFNNYYSIYLHST